MAIKGYTRGSVFEKKVKFKNWSIFWVKIQEGSERCDEGKNSEC